LQTRRLIREIEVEGRRLGLTDATVYDRCTGTFAGHLADRQCPSIAELESVENPDERESVWRSRAWRLSVLRPIVAAFAANCGHENHT
jgi:hypothetical protein